MARKRRKKGASGLVTAIGLVRFYEEVDEKIKVPPESIIIAAFAISLIAAALDVLLKAR